jgi:hypothetical protein
MYPLIDKWPITAADAPQRINDAQLRMNGRISECAYRPFRSCHKVFSETRIAKEPEAASQLCGAQRHFCGRACALAMNCSSDDMAK